MKAKWILPILIIAAAIFLLFRVLPHAQTTRGDVAGWLAALHVTPYEGTLIVGVTFVSRSGPVTGEPPEATAAISLVGTDQQVLVRGSLDRSPITLSARFPGVPGAGPVTAEVAILGSRLGLSVPVPKLAPSR